MTGPGRRLLVGSLAALVLTAGPVAAAAPSLPAAGTVSDSTAQTVQVPVWDPGTGYFWLWEWTGSRWEATAWWDGTRWVSTQPASGASSAPQAQRPAPQPRRAAPFTDRAGTTSSYHLLGQPAGMTGVLVYLDGDDMNGHDRPDSPPLGGDGGIVAAAAAAGYVTLSIRTPAADKTFWGDLPGNTAYVQELTETIAKELGMTRVGFLGYSGGSQLLTKGVLPSHPGLCTTVAVMTGGGGAGRDAPAPPDSQVAGCRLVWVTGTEDTAANAEDGYDAISDARAGQQAYAGRGWATTLQTPTGVDHADVRRMLGATLAEALKAP